MTTPDTTVRVTSAAFRADPIAALKPLKDGAQVIVVDEDGRTVLVVGYGRDLGAEYDDPVPEVDERPWTAAERQDAIDRWLR